MLKKPGTELHGLKKIDRRKGCHLNLNLNRNRHRNRFLKKVEQVYEGGDWLSDGAGSIHFF